MYVRDSVRFSILFAFGWRHVSFFLAWGAGVTACYELLHWRLLAIPFAPLSLLGIAVAFYVGFKNSQSYDRLWEARKIWGSIINSSRTFALRVLSACEPAAGGTFARALIHRHLAYINVLRLQLRRQTTWDEVSRWLSDEERAALPSWQNKATQVLFAQGKALARARAEDQVSELQHLDLLAVLDALYDAQGRCERLKNTPFPRQYAFFSRVFVWQFVLLLPFGLLEVFKATPWLAVPFYTFIAWVFMTMELVGHFSENPFENFINDVPMTALCRTVEIDVLQMLGDQQLPPPLTPVGDVLY